MFLAKYKKTFTREQEISKRAHKKNIHETVQICVQYNIVCH